MPFSPGTDAAFKYELFFELSPDLLCIAGFDGYFKKVNVAVSRLLEYSLEELYSRPVNDFVHPEDKDLTNHVRFELTQHKPLYNFENRYVTKSGEVVWLSWTSLPVPDDRLVFAIAKNITHKKKLEEERSALVHHLSRLNRDLKQLTYTTSHDLRSPVNSLLALVDMIDTSRINDDETVELMAFLQRSGLQLKETLDNYVDLLHQRHDDEIELQEQDLNISLSNVLRSIEHLRNGTTIDSDFTAFDKIQFHKAYLESIFINLISNAIKYARPGHPPVISIYTEKVENKKRLIVQDNGQGFDMEKVGDKLFGLGQRFHDHHDSKGVGLYLVNNHVTSLGGKITVESKVNEGSKFIIEFK